LTRGLSAKGSRGSPQPPAARHFVGPRGARAFRANEDTGEIVYRRADPADRRLKLAREERGGDA